MSGQFRLAFVAKIGLLNTNQRLCGSPIDYHRRTVPTELGCDNEPPATWSANP